MKAGDRPAPLNLAQIGVITFLGLAAGSAYLTRHCIAVANTAIQTDLSLSDKQMGWVLGSFAAGYFFFQIPGGWLGNRIGTRSAFTLISVLWSGFTLWTSVAAGWLAMVVSRATFGAAQAGMVPISATVISDWFQEHRRGLCSAVVAASMSIGGVVAMKLTAKMIEYYHWRDIFWTYSTVGVAWALAFFVFFRTRPEDHPWLRGARSQSSSLEQKTNAAVEPEPVPPTPPIDWNTLLRNPTIIAINVQSAFRAAGYWLFVSWFPAFLEYRFGVSRDEAGSLTAWTLAGVAAGTIIGGVCVDQILARINNKRASRSGVAFVALLTCAVLTLAAAWSPDANTFVLIMSLAALCSGAAGPSAWAATMDVAGRNTAVVMGMMNMSSTVGGFTMPVVLGYMIGEIRETGGDWNNVVYLVAAIYLAAALSWLGVNPDDVLDGLPEENAV